MIIPNSVLLAAELTNLSRSPEPVQYIPVLLDASVSAVQVQALRSAVEDWVKARPTLWTDKVQLTFATDGLGVNTLKAIVRVQQQGTWSDVNKTRSNLLEIMAFIAESIAGMGIRAKAA